MGLFQVYLGSEQRHAMTYERWLEYCLCDSQRRAKTMEDALQEVDSNLRAAMGCLALNRLDGVSHYANAALEQALAAKEPRTLQLENAGPYEGPKMALPIKKRDAAKEPKA